MVTKTMQWFHMKMKPTLTMIATIQMGFLQTAGTLLAFNLCKNSFLCYLLVTCLYYKNPKTHCTRVRQNFQIQWSFETESNVWYIFVLVQTFELETSGKSNSEWYQTTAASPEIKFPIAIRELWGNPKGWSLMDTASSNFYKLSLPKTTAASELVFWIWLRIRRSISCAVVEFYGDCHLSSKRLAPCNPQLAAWPLSLFLNTGIKQKKEWCSWKYKRADDLGRSDWFWSRLMRDVGGLWYPSTNKLGQVRGHI